MQAGRGNCVRALRMEVLAGSGVGQGNLLAQAQGTVHTDTRHNHGGKQQVSN